MIYLDNAATTFPKPIPVQNEVRRCIRSYCGNPGRGSHALSRASAETIYRCREALAGLFGLDRPENVIFTLNTTHALNQAIRGLIRPGDHVLISDMEHNAVYRPVWELARSGMISYDIFPTYTTLPDRTPEQLLQAVERLITPRTKLLICAHASNICSASLPIDRLGALCRQHNILFVVDGAQSAGILPLHMERMNIDALCVPGHKGLYGIQGSGALLLRTDVPLTPLMQGGNGVHSLEPDMPDFLPERLEAGTLPTPAVAGLLEGVRFVTSVTPEAIGTHEAALCRRLTEMLGNTPGIRLYAPHHAGSVLLFSHDDIPSDDLSRYLDDRFGICTRSGFHCAALAHRTLHTPKTGAVRISFGYYNRPDELELFLKALSQASQELKP